MIEHHPESVRVELPRVWHRVSTLFYRVGDQGRGSVFAAPALGRLIRVRVHLLISLAYPAPNQVPRLVWAAHPPLVLQSRYCLGQDTAAPVRRSSTQGAQLIRVSKKSATDRHGIPPERPMR